MEQELILTRFSIAFAASMAFGLARQRLGKPIGFGTFIFVALGACGLTLTALTFGRENPLPLLGAIVTGVGFLGAGALFKTGERVAGFTSAATIWIFAVFGLTVGAGEYLLSGLLYGTIWIVSAIDLALERRWIGAHERKLRIDLAPGTPLEILASLGLPDASKAQVVESDPETSRLSLTFSIDRDRSAVGLLDRLEASQEVRGYSIEQD